VLTYLVGSGADLALRRGWTHGVLALALWPFVLTGLMILLHRSTRRVRSTDPPAPVVIRQLLLLSSIAVLSHPILDTLNPYGMRWLMPFNARWFYGDTLFIVDPWLWLALGLGVLLSRPQPGRMRPARIALGVSFGYIVAMAVSAFAARRIAGRELAALSGEPVDRLMVSPLPVSPFVRRVVVEQGNSYRTAGFDWLTRRRIDPATIRKLSKGPVDHPAVRKAAATTVGRRFLGWARFPTFRLNRVSRADFVVHIVDLRYADSPDAPFGSVSIPVTLRGDPSQVDTIEKRSMSGPQQPVVTLWVPAPECPAALLSPSHSICD
jgi:inner membrane protein